MFALCGIDKVEPITMEDQQYRFTTVIGKYNRYDDNVEFKLPEMIDGTVNVVISRCAYTGSSMTKTFTSDNGFRLDEVVKITFCLSEEALRNARQTLPFNNIGRRAFDLQLISIFLRLSNCRIV